jgi:GalNAc-alpha-(1->4)-GalNAc-alpha-(1->3)-diNAcBac-PP-undecaprenol alpha-1,4-N-acetyl-D-galactosaminyltransferase
MKNKICLIIPTLTGGGQERVMSELANYFNEQGYEIHLIFLVRHEMFYTLNDGIKTYFPNYTYKKSIYYQITYRIHAIFHIRNVVKKVKPQTVLSMPQGYNNLAILALWKLNIPIYVSDRSSPHKKMGFIDSFLRKKCYPKASGIIAQTQTAIENFEKLGIKNENIKVIPNPLRTLSDYQNNRDPKIKRIISVGRLIESKKFDHLIDVFAQINNPNWELYIFGEGPLRKALEDVIEKHHLKNKVFLPGSTKQIDVEFSKSEIFAFTSVSEGFPNALSEAMAYPVASISYDCIAGPSDLIENGINGILIPVNNKVLFKENLEKLMLNDDLREEIAAQSRKNRIKYHKNTISKEYLEFITKA